MKKVRLGRTGLEVTRWGLGGIQLSTVMGGTTEEVIAQLINGALDYGINFIDTSRVYMDSETNLGDVLKSRRKECVIASKSYRRTRDEVLADIEESLTQLQTDKIDIYQVHALYPHEVAQVTGKDGALEAFRQAKEQGLIDFIGITSHHVSVLVDMLKTDAFDTVMFPFNVIEREPEQELLALAREKDIGTIVMKPLAGGAVRNIKDSFKFFNNYPVDLILNGVSSMAELQENLKHAETEELLTEGELRAFEKEVAVLGKDFCRRCSYCMPCPNDIHIPDMIHVFYQMVRGCRYEDLPEEKKKMGEALLIWLQVCEECGKCEEKCPYTLPTVKRKRELMEIFNR
ncbi:MAG: aldo/keto reductase [Proteobacteria bacterium]|nr:aldo/keto reductase [Pseudomonadota bacterium]